MPPTTLGQCQDLWQGAEYFLHWGCGVSTHKEHHRLTWEPPWAGTERCCPECRGQQRRPSGPLFPGSQIFTTSDAGPGDSLKTFTTPDIDSSQFFHQGSSTKSYILFYLDILLFSVRGPNIVRTLLYLYFFANYSFSALKELEAKETLSHRNVILGGIKL